MSTPAPPGASRAYLVPLLATASILGAGAALALPGLRIAGLLLSAALSAAILLLGLGALARRRRMASVESLLGPLSDEGPGAGGAGGVIAPARLAEAAAAAHPTALSLGLRGLFEVLDADLALLKRSAVKFDLFSSDIHFSASHLAELASRDLEMLGGLRARVSASKELQESAEAGLAALRLRVAEAAERAKAQAGRARAARGDLAGLVAASAEAARLAGQGLDEVAATGAEARELAERIARLDAAARREAAEASRIAEILARISDIVDRTHVLATNASIEAARAGARGGGFAVIAAEVRALAASSRHALEEIDAVLGSVSAGIRESGELAARASEGSTRLSASFSRASGTFDAIGARIGEVEDRLGSFDQAFAGQAEDSGRAAAASAAAAEELAGFAEDFAGQARDLEAVSMASSEAERSARDAERSARILAQLAGYLKHGGRNRDRVLRRWAADGRARERRLGRREEREELVYNLEVSDPSGAPLGYLGDLSPSGLLLASPVPRRPGDRLALRLRMPLSSEGERTVPLAVIVRRVENDCDEHLLGCSLEESDGSRRRAAEVIAALSLGAVAPTGAHAPAAASCQDEEPAAELEALD